MAEAGWLNPSALRVVSAEATAGVDRFAGLRRIGIDEISYKRGHRYLTVVVDHDRGRLIWAAVGGHRVGRGATAAAADS